ncbi:hypothetical protein VTK26DRAFT_3520 [Humicola hyalothermophila]
MKEQHPHTPSSDSLHQCFSQHKLARCGVPLNPENAGLKLPSPGPETELQSTLVYRPLVAVKTPCNFSRFSQGRGSEIDHGPCDADGSLSKKSPLAFCIGQVVFPVSPGSPEMYGKPKNGCVVSWVPLQEAALLLVLFLSSNTNPSGLQWIKHALVQNRPAPNALGTTISDIALQPGHLDLSAKRYHHHRPLTSCSGNSTPITPTQDTPPKLHKGTIQTHKTGVLALLSFAFGDRPTNGQNHFRR